MTAEQDFARWLDHQDADALGRVLDAMGGRLVLLASQLVDGASVGELVQATFVAAMGHGGSWDRQRPLLPWLAAILHNEARMRWRAARRRREVAIDDVPEAASEAANPSALLASRETRDRIVAAIDALPRSYRQVLKLRLVHDLQPIEIARSLEVPASTVRARLHRGLARLRAALPAGIASALAAVLVGDDELLAQIRREVLARAADAAPASTAAAGAAAASIGTASVLLTMNAKLVTALVAALLSVLLLWFAFDAPLVEPPASTGPRGPASPAQIETANAAAAAAPSTARTAVAASVEELQWPLVVDVRDRNGQPHEGAEVTVWTSPHGGSFWNRSSPHYLGEHVASGLTAADGSFRHDLLALRQKSELWRASSTLWVQARMRDAAPDFTGVKLAVDGGDQPVRVELVLLRAPAIVGRVVDADGAQVAGADVRAIGDAGRFTAVSSSDGRFHLEVSERASWPQQLVVRHGGHGAATREIPAPAEGDHVVDLGDVALSPGPSIFGRVLLGDGGPLPGWQIQLQQFDPELGEDVTTIRRWLLQHGGRRRSSTRDGASRLQARTNTDADGRFRFAGLEHDGHYLLSVWSVRPVRVVARPDGRPVDLRVQQQLLSIDVFDADGTELPGVAIHLDGFDPDGSTPSWTRRSGTPEHGQVCGNYIPCGDERGRRQVLSPFGYLWSIYTTQDALRPIEETHVAAPGAHRARVRLTVEPERRFGSLRVTAVDEAGERVRCGVLLKSLDRDLCHDHRRLVEPPEGWTIELPAGRWSVQAVLGKELVYLHGDGGFARGEQHHEVEIRAGETARLRLESPQAGLVRFELAGDAATGDVWRRLRFSRDGRPIEVLPVDPSDPRPANRHGATVDRVITRQALSPGRHTFLVRGEGVHDATVHVDVVADAVTATTVVLYPR